MTANCSDVELMPVHPTQSGVAISPMRHHTPRLELGGFEPEDLIVPSRTDGVSSGGPTGSASVRLNSNRAPVVLSWRSGSHSRTHINCPRVRLSGVFSFMRRT